jgi:hypothetical protein
MGSHAGRLALRIIGARAAEGKAGNTLVSVDGGTQPPIDALRRRPECDGWIVRRLCDMDAPLPGSVGGPAVDRTSRIGRPWSDPIRVVP